ncbi:topoisomerase C-terminal repeat-containing protein, partial [Acinetobacter baumannii]
PDSNTKVFLKNGTYGYYVQLGDDTLVYTPKRASVAEVKDVDSITLEFALDLLQYPIILGNHPEDKHPVLLAHSKFGFSIKHRRTIAPVP